MYCIINNLIKLSDIFKSGFTIIIKDGAINQYFNNDGYIISLKTLITIRTDKSGIKQITYNMYDEINLNNAIIGGWFDKDNNTYYIEKNICVKDKNKALSIAKKYGQKEIFDLKTSECIKVGV